MLAPTHFVCKKNSLQVPKYILLKFQKLAMNSLHVNKTAIDMQTANTRNGHSSVKWVSY